MQGARPGEAEGEEDAAARWAGLLARIDAWFAAGVAAHPGAVPCYVGCSACCVGPFDISAADAALLARGLGRLPLAVRAEVEARARRQVERARVAAPEWGPPWDVRAIGDDRFDEVCDALHDEPCPLLDERGRCLAYEERPLICRMMGLPMATPGGRTIENCCPIRARFPAYDALPPLQFPLEQFEEEEESALRSAARALFGDERKAGFRTFIAAWVDGLAARSATRPAPSPPPQGA